MQQKKCIEKTMNSVNKCENLDGVDNFLKKSKV